MAWFWNTREAKTPTEDRAGYTDTVVDAIVAEASGANTKSAGATAALEACASLYSAGFARAKPDPDIPAVTPAIMAMIGRDLIRRGESLFLIDVGDGLALRPVGSWDIVGGHDPATWFARCDLFGPSSNVTRLVPHSSVLHFRYASDPSRPWRGIGPMAWASASATLAGRIESGLAAEAGAAPAQLLPIPMDGGDGTDENDPLKTLKADISRAKGKTLLVESTHSGWGAGGAAAPPQDWVQKRVGAHWPEVIASTRRDMVDAVAAACGVPAALLDPRAQGVAQREALRRFAHFGLEPLGELVSAELADKLDMPGLTLDFSALMASDLAGRARAIKGMVEAGMDLQAAVMIAGLDG